MAELFKMLHKDKNKNTLKIKLNADIKINVLSTRLSIA